MLARCRATRNEEVKETVKQEEEEEKDNLDCD